MAEAHERPKSCMFPGKYDCVPSGDVFFQAMSNVGLPETLKHPLQGCGGALPVCM